MEEAIDQLLRWAVSKDIVLNGITPKALPGRGIGIVSTRSIEPGEVILRVPMSLLRTLDNTPKPIVSKLQGATVHAILAASLALDIKHPPLPDFKIWQNVNPTPADVATSMPLCWDPSLQGLLPKTGQDLLAKQRAKFDTDWALVSAAYQDSGSESLTKSEYLHAWLLVNTRTFYHTTPRTKKNLPREDHMVLQPVADLFNHSPNGCTVSFDATGFSFTTTNAIPRADEEMFIRYGAHSNDFLLVEYGFTLPTGANAFDEVRLDPYLCPKFSPSQEAALKHRGFWGGYMLDAETACYRTQVAIRMLFLSEDEWLDFLGGQRDEDRDQIKVDAILSGALEKYLEDVQKTIDEVNDASVGDVIRNSIRERWQQIAELLKAAITRLNS